MPRILSQLCCSLCRAKPAAPSPTTPPQITKNHRQVLALLQVRYIEADGVAVHLETSERGELNLRALKRMAAEAATPGPARELLEVDLGEATRLTEMVTGHTACATRPRRQVTVLDAEDLPPNARAVLLTVRDSTCEVDCETMERPNRAEGFEQQQQPDPQGTFSVADPSALLHVEVMGT